MFLNSCWTFPKANFVPPLSSVIMFMNLHRNARQTAFEAVPAACSWSNIDARPFKNFYILFNCKAHCILIVRCYHDSNLVRRLALVLQCLDATQALCQRAVIHFRCGFVCGVGWVWVAQSSSSCSLLQHTNFPSLGTSLQIYLFQKGQYRWQMKIYYQIV